LRAVAGTLKLANRRRKHEARMHPAATKLFDLSERVALVTGSSMGIGFGIARGLAQASARASRPPPRNFAPRGSTPALRPST
jgi:hypothetical protein